MFCSHCGTAIPDDARFCPKCGVGVGPGPTEGPLTTSSPASALTTASQLVMVWDKLAMIRNYRFEDGAGNPLGTTQGQVAFPLKYTLLDSEGKVVLVLDGGREHGLQFAYWVHDANGAVLATFRVRSSFMSRRYGITVGGTERYLLWTDATGYQYRVEELGTSRVLATGTRTMAVRWSRTQIEIGEGSELDHRIVLGSMILADHIATANV